MRRKRPGLAGLNAPRILAVMAGRPKFDCDCDGEYYTEDSEGNPIIPVCGICGGTAVA